MNSHSSDSIWQRTRLGMTPAPEDAIEPLLASENGSVREAGEDHSPGKRQAGVWAAEFRHILLLSAPAIVQLCTQQALVITNQACCVDASPWRRPHALQKSALAADACDSGSNARFVVIDMQPIGIECNVTSW